MMVFVVVIINNSVMVMVINYIHPWNLEGVVVVVVVVVDQPPLYSSSSSSY